LSVLGTSEATRRGKEEKAWKPSLITVKRNGPPKKGKRKNFSVHREGRGKRLTRTALSKKTVF